MQCNFIWLKKGMGVLMQATRMNLEDLMGSEGSRPQNPLTESLYLKCLQ